MAFQFGIKEIDDQHAEITQLVERMIAAVESRHSILDVHYHVVHLHNAAVHHFRLEESLMRIFRYPLHDAHATLHANILGKLDELKQLSLRTGVIDWTKVDAKTMFISHMDEHDRDLCKFILAAFPADTSRTQVATVPPAPVAR